MAPTKKAMPELRRRKILKWLAEEGSLSIPELEMRLGISHMTVHRDLTVLAEKGKIRKIRGGAIFIEGTKELGQQDATCALCGGRRMSRLEVLVTLRDGQAIYTCCAHCAILYLTGKDEIESALARDFLYGRRINLYQATLLIESEVRLCCMPSTLCFATESDAVRFKKGFGGLVMNFPTAQAHMANSHKGHHEK